MRTLIKHGNLLRSFVKRMNYRNARFKMGKTDALKGKSTKQTNGKRIGGNMNKYLQKVVELYETWKAKWEDLNKKGKLIVSGLVLVTVIILLKVL